MKLEFKKVGSRYEAEFEATGDFNLHIERQKRGSLAIFQKTSVDDKYASESSYSDSAEPIVNKDFSMLIYPKFIKVVSSSPVTRCVATISGGGIVDNTPAKVAGFNGTIAFNTPVNDEYTVVECDGGIYRIKKEQIQTYSQIYIPIVGSIVFVKNLNIAKNRFDLTGVQLETSYDFQNKATTLTFTVHTIDGDLSGGWSDYFGDIEFELYSIN